MTGTLAVLVAVLFSSSLEAPRLRVAGRPVAGPAGERNEVRFVYSDRHPGILRNGRESMVVRSLLRTDMQMGFGSYVWNADGVPKGPVVVRVDLDTQSISAFRSGHEIGTAVVIYGSDGKPTPTGSFPVLAKAVRHRSSLYDAEMPFMLRLTGDGVSIHASSIKAGSATHGCIGIPSGFARLLYGEIRTGDVVHIVHGMPDSKNNI